MGRPSAKQRKPYNLDAILDVAVGVFRERGYDGGYDALRRYAKRWAKDRGQATAAAYVPLSFAPGEAYQFDWSQEVVLLNGVTVIVKVAHVRLCHSRMLFVRAYTQCCARSKGGSFLRKIISTYIPYSGHCLAEAARSEKCQRTNPLSREALAGRSGALRLPQ